MTSPILWFDEKHKQAAAHVVLLTPDGRFILQVRDDIPGIDNPGQITPFGGAAEPGETPIACALRELAEETGIRPEATALRYLDSVTKIDFRGHATACVFYLLSGVDPATLAVTEGQAIVMSADEVGRDPRPTPFTQQLAALIRQTVSVPSGEPEQNSLA